MFHVTQSGTHVYIHIWESAHADFSIIIWPRLYFLRLFAIVSIAIYTCGYIRVDQVRWLIAYIVVGRAFEYVSRSGSWVSRNQDLQAQGTCCLEIVHEIPCPLSTSAYRTFVYILYNFILSVEDAPFWREKLDCFEMYYTSCYINNV